MDRNGTDGPIEEAEVLSEADAPRALVAAEGIVRPGRVTGGRPMAGFLAQLIVSTEPALRPARHERTKAAAALYARAAYDRPI